jgi:membrane-associated phospholipid phosphatase
MSNQTETRNRVSNQRLMPDGCHTKENSMKTFSKITLAAAVLAFAPGVRADEVTDWNQNMLHAALVAKTSPMVTSRVGALVQTAVFDALNGIERRYKPIHVTADAPRHASRRAAVAQAAYTILVDLFPAQKPDLDAKLAASLAALMDGDGDADEESVLRGVGWGQSVADAIWTWRSTDGFTPAPPPFLGGTAVGEWRPTPPAFAPGATPQFATMTPWGIQAPSQFRPGGPPALSSDRYATVFNETKSMGSALSTLRTADQTLFSKFWNSSTVTYDWNTIAVELANQRHFTMSENAHLLALLNMAIADAVIACWNAKYYYVSWRPVTAIPLADTDGNPATDADPTWTPLLITPAHPEYPSGHSTTSSAAATVLAHFFGEHSSFTVDSDVMLGVTRSFTSFSAAQDEIANARIFGGIHFRTACDDGRVTGQKVADYILEHSALQIHGHDGHGHDGDDGHNHD